MLTEISVRNVALIEEATLELSPGLNAITGETGAGKTLLATALQLLLGGRARSEAVRAGAEKATIEGTFVPPEETGPDLLAAALADLPRAARAGAGTATIEGAFVLPGEPGPDLLAEALGDLAEEVDADDGLVLRRTLTGEGRSRCFVGGVAVPVRALGTLGERLVSYHSQREQARLTEPAEQLAILDDFLTGGALKARRAHAAGWRSVEAARRELAEVRATGEARLREADFLRFQVGELEAAGYNSQEADELARERDRLRNATDLQQSAAAAAALLSSEEGGGGVALAAGRRRGAR